MSEETPEYIVPTEDVTELTERTNGQIQPKCYQYNVITPTDQFQISVIASNGTAAREGLKQNLPDATFTFISMSKHIMQVNG